jgi:hypothetical protein
MDMSRMHDDRSLDHAESTVSEPAILTHTILASTCAIPRRCQGWWPALLASLTCMLLGIGPVWSANPEICEDPEVVLELPTVTGVVDGPEEIGPEDTGTWQAQSLGIPGSVQRCEQVTPVAGDTTWSWSVRALDEAGEAEVASGIGPVAALAGDAAAAGASLTTSSFLGGSLGHLRGIGTYAIRFTAVTVFRGRHRICILPPWYIKVKPVTVYVESVTVQESGTMPMPQGYGYATADVRVRLSRKVNAPVSVDLVDRGGTATAYDYGWEAHPNAGPVLVYEAWPGLGIPPPPGTAIQQRAPGRAVFAPGQQIYRLPLTIVQDAVAEGPETIQLHLQNAVGAVIQQTPGIVTIADDDLGIVPVVSLAEQRREVVSGQQVDWVLQVDPAPTAPLSILVGWYQATLRWPLNIGLAEQTTVVCPAGIHRVVMPSTMQIHGPVPGDSFLGTLAILSSEAYRAGATWPTTSVWTAASANTPPTISPIADQGPAALQAAVGPLAFTVSDAETPVGALVVTATAADPTIVDPASIMLGGSDTHRWISLGTTAIPGTTAVTVTVSDGQLTASTTFTVSNSTAVNRPPRILAVTASPQPVTGTTTTLQVVAQDDVDTGHLVCTWTVQGPDVVSLSRNRSVDAATTTATFCRTGTYPVTVTVTNGAGLSATATTTVTVVATSTQVGIEPSSVHLSVNTGMRFHLSNTDQFGQPMTSWTATWSVFGVGQIDQTGLYLAGTILGTATIRATLPSGQSATAQVQVDNNPMIVLTSDGSAVTSDPQPVTGTMSTVQVMVHNGVAPYTATWSASCATDPTAPAPGIDARTDLTAVMTWPRAGQWVVTVVIRDALGATVTGSGTVVVQQTPTTVVVTPASTVCDGGQSQAFTAKVHDQFGDVASQPVDWMVLPATVGSIDAAGVLTVAPETRATAATVQAQCGAAAGIAQVMVRPLPLPHLAVAWAPDGTQAHVTLQVADGVGTLQATWSVTGPTSATLGGASTSGADIAVTQLGTYQVTVVVADDRMVPVSTALELPVPLVLASLTVTPASATVVAVTDTVSFAVTDAVDQFGATLDASAVPVTWTITPGAGLITAAGVATINPATTQLEAVVTAMAGGRSSTGVVTMTLPAPPGAVTVTRIAPIPADVIVGTAIFQATVDGATTTDGLQYQWQTAPQDPPVTWLVDPLQPDVGSVTFTQTGAHTIQCTVTNAVGRTAVGTITVMVAGLTSVTPTITWPAPLTYAYGTALDTTYLPIEARWNDTPIACSWMYDPPVGTVLTAGTHTLQATCMPTSTSFAVTTTTATLTVTPAVPQLAWEQPDAMGIDEPLSAAQLRATASWSGQPVSGTWVYTPAAGTLLSEGVHVLSATFTPVDMANIATVHIQVPLTVEDRAPTITDVQVMSSPVTGHTAQVSVAAVDDGGAAQLTYRWTATGPAPVAVAYHGVHGMAEVTFTAAGSYTLTATVMDSREHQVTADVAIVVEAIPTRVAIQPTAVAITTGAVVALTAQLENQFGHAMDIAASGIEWSMAASESVATLAATGATALVTGGVERGTATVDVTAGGMTATTIIAVQLPEDGPVVHIAVDTADVEEGRAPATYRVTRTGDLTQPLTVGYTVGGTATPAADYSLLPGFLVLPAGTATSTITVAAAVDDAVDEGDETIVVSVGAGVGYAIGSPGSATVTIHPSLDIVEQPQLTLREDQKSGSVTVVVRDADPAQVTITVARRSAWNVLEPLALTEVTADVQGTLSTVTGVVHLQTSGAQILSITARNRFGSTVSKDVAVTVPTQLTRIVVNGPSLIDRGIASYFSIEVYDQFDTRRGVSGQPVWEATGASITPKSTSYASVTAGTAVGTATVQASLAGITATRTVTVNQPPVIPACTVTAGAASTELAIATVMTDDLNPQGVTWTWTLLTGDASRIRLLPTSGTGTVVQTRAVCTSAGDWTFRLRAQDSRGLVSELLVPITMGRQVTSVQVTPAVVSGEMVGPIVLSAVVRDQFGARLDSHNPLNWSRTGPGQITSEGVYTRDASGSGALIAAAVDGVVGYAIVQAGLTPDAPDSSFFEEHADPTMPPQVRISISSGLTGDRDATIQGRAWQLTNQQSITCVVSASIPVGSVVVSVDVDSTLGARGTSSRLGTVSITDVPEGPQDVSATVTVQMSNGERISGRSTVPCALWADFTPPRLDYVWNLSYLYPNTSVDTWWPFVLSDDDEDMITLNGMSDDDNRYNYARLYTGSFHQVFARDTFQLYASVDDATGVSRQTVAQATASTHVLDATATFASDLGEADRVMVSGFQVLPESIEYDTATLRHSVYRGKQRVALTVTDRAGNQVSDDAVRLWVKTRKPLVRLGVVGVGGQWSDVAVRTDLSQVKVWPIGPIVAESDAVYVNNVPNSKGEYAVGMVRTTDSLVGVDHLQDDTYLAVFQGTYEPAGTLTAIDSAGNVGTWVPETTPIRPFIHTMASPPPHYTDFPPVQNHYYSYDETWSGTLMTPSYFPVYPIVDELLMAGRSMGWNLSTTYGSTVPGTINIGGSSDGWWRPFGYTVESGRERFLFNNYQDVIQVASWQHTTTSGSGVTTEENPFRSWPVSLGHGYHNEFHFQSVGVSRWGWGPVFTYDATWGGAQTFDNAAYPFVESMDDVWDGPILAGVVPSWSNQTQPTTVAMFNTLRFFGYNNASLDVRSPWLESFHTEFQGIPSVVPATLNLPSAVGYHAAPVRIVGTGQVRDVQESYRSDGEYYSRTENWLTIPVDRNAVPWALGGLGAHVIRMTPDVLVAGQGRYVSWRGLPGRSFYFSDLVRAIRDADGNNISLFENVGPGYPAVVPDAWEDKIVFGEQRRNIDVPHGRTMPTRYVYMRVGSRVLPKLYDVELRGAHRMKEALAVVSLDGLAGHRFGSIHMKKMYRKDVGSAGWDRYITNDGVFEIGQYWFVTDKIGTNDPNYGIFETGPINDDFKYDLFGCTKVGPQMYAQYQGMLDAINSSRRWIAWFFNQPAPVDYTISDLFDFVMSAQGYHLDQQKVTEGRYWQSPGYTATGENEITGRVEIRGRGIPIKLKLSVNQLTARVDYNDDRQVNATDDQLKDSARMKFWVNDNTGYSEGVVSDGTNDVPSGNDASDDHVNGVRDLVDLSQLNLTMDRDLMKMLNESRGRYKLLAKYENGDGRVKVYPVSSPIVRAGDPASDGSCLTNEYIARLAVQRASNLGANNAIFGGTAPPSSFTYSTENWFLVEGTHAGTVDVVLEIVDGQTGDHIPCDTIRYDFKAIGDMYLHYRVSGQEVPIEANLGTETTRTRYESINYHAGKHISDMRDGAPVIVFLHGFNVDLPASVNWFNEVYKRLYWSRYKGEFMGVTWNGAIGGGAAPILFNTNIESSFKTGPTLSYFLDDIGSGHPITLMAHSAGNIAILESLRVDSVRQITPRVTNVITTQAATFTSVYDDFIDVPFKNISHNNLFRSSLAAVTGKRWNFYSANDNTLAGTLILNETAPPPLGFKAPGYISTAQQRLEMEAIPRTNHRVAMEIPGTRSPGPSLPDFSVADIVPNLTKPLGNRAVPQTDSLNCEQIGFGVRDGGRNALAGSHSFIRETNYYETYMTYRKMVEIAQ